MSMATPPAEGFHAGKDEELPFVVGRMRGLRSFKVTPEGELTGVWYEVPWGTEVQEAAHYTHIFGQTGRETVRDGLFMAQTKHRVAGSNCACGFYGYTDGSDLYRTRSDTMTGIVEGWGTVTKGTKGFRSSKAKLVALVDDKPVEEQEPEYGRFDRFCMRVADKVRLSWFMVPMVAIIAASIALGFLVADGLFALMPLAVVYSAVLSRIVARGDQLWLGRLIQRLKFDIQGFAIRSKFADKVLSNPKYKDIPVYGSLEEALKDFPLGEVQ